MPQFLFPAVQHISSTPKTPQFNTPLTQKIALYKWCGEGFDVELRSFRCGTEGFLGVEVRGFHVELRGFLCRTEGFLVRN